MIYILDNPRCFVFAWPNSVIVEFSIEIELWKWPCYPSFGASSIHQVWPKFDDDDTTLRLLSVESEHTRFSIVEISAVWQRCIFIYIVNKLLNRAELPHECKIQKPYGLNSWSRWIIKNRFTFEFGVWIEQFGTSTIRYRQTHSFLSNEDAIWILFCFSFENCSRCVQSYHSQPKFGTVTDLQASSVWNNSVFAVIHLLRDNVKPKCKNISYFQRHINELLFKICRA